VPAPSAELAVDDGVLRQHPLPEVDGEASKHARGTVTVVGSDRETLGATMLAGVAALRAGAGRLRMIVVPDAVGAVAVAVPEARVTGFPIAEDVLRDTDVVLVGPGTMSGEQGSDLVAGVLPYLPAGSTLVLDAGALAAFDGDGLDRALRRRTIAIPNPVEAAHVLDTDVDALVEDPAAAVDALVDRLGATVAFRDAVTRIGTPDGDRFVDDSGHAALGTCGSGDVFAGLLAGLVARGAAPLTALLWSVHAHGRAGELLAQRFGGIGLIARDLLDVIPVALNHPSNCT
jgi:hydroxyethylthiazole kinase-like uncharacterized protein yjeF